MTTHIIFNAHHTQEEAIFAQVFDTIEVDETNEAAVKVFEQMSSAITSVANVVVEELDMELYHSM